MSDLKSTTNEQLQDISELPISDISLQEHQAAAEKHVSTANSDDDPAKLHQETGQDKRVPESPKSRSEPNKSKYRYDWYQTASDVYLNIMIKGLKKDSVHVEFVEKMVSKFQSLILHVYQQV